MIEAIRSGFIGHGLPREQLFFDSFDYAPDTLARMQNVRAQRTEPRVSSVAAHARQVGPPADGLGHGLAQRLRGTLRFPHLLEQIREDQAALRVRAARNARLEITAGLAEKFGAEAQARAGAE